MKHPSAQGLAVLLSVFTISAFGAIDNASPYSCRVWQIEDGLPHSIVQAITQTRDGYLWVGTREGLARFDGVNFEPVEMSPDISAFSIRALLGSDDGSLWIGTEGAGVFHLIDGKMIPCPAQDGAKDFEVSEMFQGRDGTIWINTSKGVMKWLNGSMKYIENARKGFTSISLDDNGRLWMAGLGIKFLEGNTLKTYQILSKGVPNFPRKLFAGRGGKLWLGISGGVTVLKDGLANFHKKCEGPPGFCSVILESSSGEVWVGTYSGLSRLVDGAFIDENRPEMQSSYRVFCIYEDREKNIWVGSEEGLARFTPRAFATYAQQQGLSGNIAITVCPSHDGSTWISTWGSGINHLMKDGSIVHYTQTNGLSSDFVQGICEARDGSLWIGMDWGAGLNHLQNGKISVYGKGTEFAHRALIAVLEDSEGTIWVGTRSSLTLFKSGKFERYSMKDGLADDWINALCPGEEGIIWIGTRGGLTRWQNGRFADLTAQNAQLKVEILCLYEDAEDTLWIGTRGRGLASYKGGDVRFFTTRDGLFNDSIYGIVEDGRKNLWLNSSKGIFRVSKDGLKSIARGESVSINSVRYGKMDGIISSGQYHFVTQPAACKGVDGKLWFRTTQGAVMVGPDKITTNDQSPPVLIDEIIADNKTVFSDWSTRATGRPDVSPRRLSFSNDPIHIQPGRGELEIHYKALSFRAPEKNRYKYKLEGVDPDWKDVRSRQVAYYSNLSPGEYRFRVKACNNDEVWNEEGAVATFVLAPHFWQTWWFISLCGIIGAGAIGGGALYMTHKKMQRRVVRLEQQHAIEKERARIARDMHDELGAKLTQISFQGASAQRQINHPSEIQEAVAKMSRTARDLVASLDEIVWAVDPENDSLENLANYICRFTTEFFEGSPISYQFIIPPKLPPCRLPADVRHNIFLAVKEALNNVLKHSGTSSVRISISATEQYFEITIADSGRGMTPQAMSNSPLGNKRAGHGLTNLKTRLATIGGHCELTSEPGKGTCIQFIIPVEDVYN